VRWAALSLGLGALLWVPPIVDEVTSDPGNLRVLVDNFRHPPADRPPFDQVAHAWISHLDPVELVTTDLAPRGSAVPGLILLAVWLAAATLAWRRRQASAALLRLHAVAAGAAVLGLVSMSRVLGPIWSYLTLWAWGTTAVILLAVGWTVVALAGSQLTRPALRTAGPRVLAAATVALASLFAFDAASAELYNAPLSRELDRLAAATEARLDEDPAGCGDRCRYQVGWTDTTYLGAQGYSLVVELRRRGFDAGAPPREAGLLGDQWVVDDGEADAAVRLVVSDRLIEATRSLPGAEQIAYADPYTAAEREQNERLRRRTARALRAEGFDSRAERVARADDHRQVPLDSAMSVALRRLVQQVNDLYRPAAVFLLPPPDG
jgi:hypothetical protein